MSKLIGYDYGASFNTFQTTTSNSTNSTSITALGSVLIPGGTYGLGNAVRCFGSFDKVNANGGYDTRLYWNTTPNLSGSPTLFATNATATVQAAQFLPLYKFLLINSLTGANNTFIYPLGVTTLVNDLNPTTSSPSTISIDWTIDGYVVFAGAVTSTSDTLNFRWGKVING